MKNPLTPAGIEPATFRFVTQYLNHCATAVPLVVYCTVGIEHVKFSRSHRHKTWFRRGQRRRFKAPACLATTFYELSLLNWTFFALPPYWFSVLVFKSLQYVQCKRPEYVEICSFLLLFLISRPDSTIKAVTGRWLCMQMQLFIKVTAD